MDTAAPPPPTAAQLKELESALYWGDFTLVAYSCFFTLVCYDILITLPEERSKIWKARASLVKGMYLFNRYFGLGAFFCVLLMYNIQVTTATCLRYVKWEPALMIPVFACYQSILAARCYALWGRNSFVAGGLGALILSNVVYQAYVVSQTTAIVVPGYDTYSCIVTGDNRLISGYFLLPLAVDVAITIVSFWKIIELTKKTDSPVLRVFAREGALFFSVVFFCNLANGILYLQPYQPVSSIFAGGAIILSSVSSAKLILSLRSPEAFHESHNADSRNVSNPALKPLSRRTATANLSLTHENAFHNDVDREDEKVTPDEIRMNDLESYGPGMGDKSNILVTKTRTVEYGA